MRHHFSPRELLVGFAVISVIAILASMLFRVMNMVRQQA